jgi:hypothetical protein
MKLVLFLSLIINSSFLFAEIVEYPEDGVIVDKYEKIMIAYKTNETHLYLDWFKAKQICQKAKFMGYKDWKIIKPEQLSLFYSHKKEYFEQCKHFRSKLIGNSASFWISDKCSCGKFTNGKQVKFDQEDYLFQTKAKISHGEVMCVRSL